MSKHVSRSEPIPHTCPKIDRLQKTLTDINDMLSDAVTELEEIRAANLTLRNWGNDLVSELEKAEKELDDANSEISRLNDIIQNGE